MIVHKRTFYLGLILILIFFVVLAIMFSPVFKGQNGLEYLDDLYNSISKGSAYYVPEVREEIDSQFGNIVTVSIDMGDKKKADQVSLLFRKGDANVEVMESRLKITGDLGRILGNCLNDSDSMYKNKGQTISQKYGYDERKDMYNCWIACHEMDKDLKKQQKFKEAEVVDFLMERAVETSYNYYKIEPQKITERLGIVIFSLVFYVLYTLWYGFAIMYLLDGLGFKLEDH